MGSKEGEGNKNEQPQHALYLPTFYIGKAPVTVGVYREYLAKTGRQWKKREDSKILNIIADHPVAEVSWGEALAFAESQGFGLPSEAEWEKAARGTDGSRYPWGNKWEKDLANSYRNWFSIILTAPLPFSNTGWVHTTPVGKFSPQGNSPYGCVDMAGNVLEWTRSLWGKKRSRPDFGYPYDPDDGRESLKAGMTSLGVLRGGSYMDHSDGLCCACRFHDLIGNWQAYVGFRVVLLPFSSESLIL
jgi:formylglycine-generating enzyme required for sulfatase activity